MSGLFSLLQESITAHRCQAAEIEQRYRDEPRLKLPIVYATYRPGFYQNHFLGVDCVETTMLACRLAEAKARVFSWQNIVDTSWMLDDQAWEKGTDCASDSMLEAFFPEKTAAAKQAKEFIRRQGSTGTIIQLGGDPYRREIFGAVSVKRRLFLKDRMIYSPSFDGRQESHILVTSLNISDVRQKIAEAALMTAQVAHRPVVDEPVVRGAAAARPS